MVSPNDRLIGQPMNGSNLSNGLSTHSSIDSVATTPVIDDTDSLVVTSLELHRLLSQISFVDTDRHVFIGDDSDGRRLCLGAVHVTTQRRSITKELDVVANGLKPVKGSTNKFSVNQINENKSTIGYYRNESVIEFTKCPQSRDAYPMSADTNIVATGPDSQLFIKDDNHLIEIRSNDGFVLIDSELTIIKNKEDSEGNDVIAHHYSPQQKGNLFILGFGTHLIVIDKNKPNESVLLVGRGGLDVQSSKQSSNNQKNDHKCSDSCIDRPLVLKKSSFNSLKLNGLNGHEIQTKSSNDFKRQLPESESKSKKQKCEDWTHSQPFVDTTQS